jgi:Helix-turn-helix domain
MNLTMEAREPFVSAEIAAEFLGINARAVSRMARAGSLPAHPLGDGQRKRWRFLLSELDAAMRGRNNCSRQPVPLERRA